MIWICLDFILVTYSSSKGREYFLVLFLANREAVVPLAIDLIILQRSIWSLDTSYTKICPLVMTLSTVVECLYFYFLSLNNFRRTESHRCLKIWNIFIIACFITFGSHLVLQGGRHLMHEMPLTYWLVMGIFYSETWHTCLFGLITNLF